MANNLTGITTNLNIAPYFDDYDESKGYYKILFKPGLAVQARELTQIQTLTQKQIERFGNHVFKNGSIVSGGQIEMDFNYNFVKIRNNDVSNNSINVTNLFGREVTHAPSGLKALVVNVATGDENLAETKTIFVKYLNSGSGGEKNFANNLTLTANNGIQFTSVNSANSFGLGCAVSISEGVIYAKGHFIKFPSQTLLLQRYDNKPTTRIGFKINESIVTASTDITLTDPANGSPNYAAPGADRLKLVAEFTRLEPYIIDDEFIMLYEIFNGVIQQTYEQKTIYSDLAKEQARDRYNESGNYTVNGLNVALFEHLDTGNNNGLYMANDTIVAGNNFNLVASVEPGEAYVEGFYYKNLISRNLTLSKGIGTANVNSQIVPVNFGNYAIVRENAGFWSLQENTIVEIYDTPQERVLRGRFSGVAPVLGNRIGTARFKQIEYLSQTEGTAEAQFAVYLSDVTMANNSFSNARSLYFNNPTKPDAYADLVLESGRAVMKDSAFTTSLYVLPVSGVKTLRDATGNVDSTFIMSRNFSASIATNGQFTLTTGSNNEVFVGSGNLSQTLRQGIQVVLDSAANTANLAGTITVTASNTTVTGTGTSFTTTINVGDIISPASSGEILIVNAISNNTSLSIRSVANTSASANTYFRRFLQGQRINLNGVGAFANATTSTSMTINIGATLVNSPNASVTLPVSKVNALEKKKVLRRDRLVKIFTGNNASTINGPYDLGVSDIFRITDIRRKTGSDFANTTDGTSVTNLFTFNTGQTQDNYNHSSITRNGIVLANNDYLLVRFDFFEHDGTLGNGYFSVDSYPVDDANTANLNAIQTKQIPVFISDKRKTFDLRDCIDFRLAEENTATLTTSIGSASINPVSSNNYQTFSGRLDFPVNKTQFFADLSYYLGRKDIIYLTKDGTFGIIPGDYSGRPITPKAPENSLVLATVDVAPFPSLPRTEATFYNRPQYANSIRNISNRRYTMRDVGVLDQRIRNLEYYISLSLLEKDTLTMKITDENGLDRFKNGILVDSFTGHNIGNVYDPGYLCAIDPKERELRPSFNLRQLPLRVISLTNTTDKTNDIIITANNVTGLQPGDFVYQGNVASPIATGYVHYIMGNKVNIEKRSGSFVVNTAISKDTTQSVINTSNTYTILPTAIKTFNSGSLIRLDNISYPMVRQPFCSGTSKVSGDDFNWIGRIQFYPNDIDAWVETKTSPQINVNIDNQADNWAVVANAFGTQWNSWQTVWTGSTTEETTSSTWNGGTITNRTTTTTQNQDRTGSGYTVQNAPENIQNAGTRVTDVTLTPYMRSKSIFFYAYGLRPNTRVYPFFDSVNVELYCGPVTQQNLLANIDTTIYGSALTTDADGKLYGVFSIPNNDSIKFTVGTKTFRLTDNPKNFSGKNDMSTSAEAQYTASGLVQTKQDTVISTRPVKITNSTMTEKRSVVSITTDAILHNPTPVASNDPSAYYQFSHNGGGGGTCNNPYSPPNEASSTTISDSAATGGGGGGGGKILCTYYKDIKWLPKDVWLHDMLYSARLLNSESDYFRTVNLGYQSWATSILNYLKTSDTKLSNVIRVVVFKAFVNPWALSMAHEANPMKYKKNLLGKFYMKALTPISYLIGKYMLNKEKSNMVKST